MKRGLILGLSSLLVVLLMVSTGWASKGFKVGYVDFQQILNESVRGKEAKELLTKERDFRSRQLRERDEQLKTRMGDLQQRRSVLSAEAFQKEQQELMMQQQQFSNNLQEVQGNLMRKEQELTADILEEVQRVIDEIARKEGYDLILERNEAGVMYAPSEHDVTAKVLRLYNSRHAGESKKK